MNPLVIKIIEMALTLFAPFLKKLVDLAYERIEEWAHKEEKEGAKPTPEAKMAKAIAMVKEQKPDVADATIKALLEMKHAKTVRKEGVRVNKSGGL